MKQLLLGLAIGVASMTAIPVLAQNFPTRPITVVVPYEAGGTTDVLFRVIAPGMERRLGQTVIVLNRGGASAIIGTESVVRAKPDGYTLVVATAGLPIAASYIKDFPFDIRKDLVPIASYANTPYFLFANSKLPVNSVQDLVALAKKNPGKITFGSSGAGQSGHLAGAKFALTTGVEMLHVPYKGTAGAMNDLAAGHIDTIFVGLPTATPQLEAGRIKILAAASPERISLRPDVPTVAEAGFPGFDARAWYGLLAPAGTPMAIRQKIADAVEASMREKQTTDHFGALGAVPFVQGVDAFTKFFNEDAESVDKLVRNFPGGLK